MKRTLWKVALFALALQGCAEGGGPATIGDTDMGGATENAANSTQNSTTNSANNTSTPDLGQEEDPCELCCPGDMACLEDGTLGRCASDGKSFLSTSCSEGQICEDGACVEPPVCTAGEKRCYDAKTVMTCRASGDGFATSQCGADETCVNGTCASGDPIGTICTADDACVTDNCHCPADGSESCPAEITQGYCTTTGCDSETCGQDAACVIGSLVSLGNTDADYDHCVPRCSEPCESGLECRLLPTRGPNGVIEWAQGCYFPGMVDIGNDCDTDLECAAGVCLTDYFSANQPGFCTRRCDADSACPDGSACVELRAGEFYCSLLCGDGSVIGTDPCPMDVPDERFDAECRYLRTPSGGGYRVCSAI